MKNNKLIISSIIASVVLVVGAVFIYFIINPQSLNNDNEENNRTVFDDNNETIQEDTENLTDENLADNIEVEQGNQMIEQRPISDLDNNMVVEIQTVINDYINGRYAPVNEEQYNEAISMHSQEVIDNNDFSYQEQFENSYALNEEKSIEDVTVNVNELNAEGVEGSYSFILVVELSNSTEEINHEGDFTLSTYDNGYMYISEFGDTNE